MNRQLLRSAQALPLALVLIYTNSVYYELPSPMPTHWGINGQPNGWSSREFGAWFLPVMMIFVWGLFLVIPLVDRRKVNREKFGVVYELIVAAVLGFQAVVQWAMLSAALGHPVAVNTVVYVALGALYTLLGAAMPFAKPSRYLTVVGILMMGG